MKKRYYKINEVANIVGVETSTLRYWEKEFGKLHYKRSDVKSKKLYTEENLDHVKEIYRLLKAELYTLEGAKRQLKLNKQLLI